MQNSTYKLDENRTFMIKDNILWLKVFYHNTTFGDYFSSLDEALDSHTAQKFSILGTIDDSFRVNGKFEFLLEIPGKHGYNRWRQIINPKDTTSATDGEANEYEEIKISWREKFYGGLAKNNADSTYFDCSAGDDLYWWYPIGATRYYTIINTIPLNLNERYEGPEITLWIRCPSLSADGFKQPTCYYNRRRIDHIIMKGIDDFSIL